MPKKQKTKSSKPSKPGVRVFVYTSACHGVPAVKEPLQNVGLEEAKEAHGLGKFRCGQCGKRCKVARTKKTNSEEEAQ